MKKTFITAAMMLACAFSMNAQNGKIRDFSDNLEERSEEFREKVPGKNSECSVATPEIIGLGLIDAGTSSPFDFNTNKSIEVFFYDMFSNHIFGDIYFTHGHGFGWKNMTLTGDNAMKMLGDGNIVTYDMSAYDYYKLSRLRVFSFSVPLMLTLDFHHNCGISIGPVLNANLSSRINTKYNDGSPKDKYKGVHEQFFTADIMADITLLDLHFWVKYSPMNLMKTEYGWPEMQTISAGIAF